MAPDLQPVDNVDVEHPKIDVNIMYWINVWVAQR